MTTATGNRKFLIEASVVKNVDVLEGSLLRIFHGIKCLRLEICLFKKVAYIFAFYLFHYT